MDPQNKKGQTVYPNFIDNLEQSKKRLNFNFKTFP